MTCPRAPSTEQSSWERPGHMPVAPSTQATLNGRPGCALHKATLQEAPRKGQHSPSAWPAWPFLIPVPFNSLAGVQRRQKIMSYLFPVSSQET